MFIPNRRIRIRRGLCLVLCLTLSAPEAFGQAQGPLLGQCPGQVNIPWINAGKIRTELNKQVTLSRSDRQTLIDYHRCIAIHYKDLLRRTQAQNCQAVLQEYFDAAQNLPTIQTQNYTCELPDRLRPPPS